MNSDIFEIKANLPWLETIPTSIDTVFMKKLYGNGVFNELQNFYKRILWKRKLIKSNLVGVWGWNSWCGIHCFPVLTGKSINQILTKTYDVGFNRTEPITGLLPHAIIHRNGQFGSEHTYRCYGGMHSESYNLDNILCWAKMAMEYFLVSHDTTWFTQEKWKIITTTIDYILTKCRGKYSKELIYAGIEGDWTECTNWELDNADVTINMLNSLQLAIETQKLLGNPKTILDYKNIYQEMKTKFNQPYTQGGFWHPEKGFYIHGNNGNGTQIHGDQYFEATVNYLSILWKISEPDQQKAIFKYIDEHKEPIEVPYPVLTNYLPRTGARRSNYGKTVTNGDVWMVLGSHAAAARLQAGFIAEGSEMYHTIIKYEQEHQALHNCVYMDGSVNDSWTPEIANYGALYAAFVLGVLGIRPLAEGLQFNITGLTGLTELTTTLFFDQQPIRLAIQWSNQQLIGGKVQVLDQDFHTKREFSLNNARFLLKRTDSGPIIDK